MPTIVFYFKTRFYSHIPLSPTEYTQGLNILYITNITTAYMPTIVCFGNLWVNKVSVRFLQQLDLKNKNKTEVQLYRFGINGLSSRRHDPHPGAKQLD